MCLKKNIWVCEWNKDISLLSVIHINTSQDSFFIFQVAYLTHKCRWRASLSDSRAGYRRSTWVKSDSPGLCVRAALTGTSPMNAQGGRRWGWSPSWLEGRRLWSQPLTHGLDWERRQRKVRGKNPFLPSSISHMACGNQFGGAPGLSLCPNPLAPIFFWNGAMLELGWKESHGLMLW